MVQRPRTLLHSYLAHPLRSHLERVLTYYGLDPAQHVLRFTATVNDLYRDENGDHTKLRLNANTSNLHSILY